MAVQPLTNEEFDYVIAYRPGVANRFTLTGTIGAHYVTTSCLGNLDPFGRLKFSFVQRPGDRFASVVSWPFENYSLNTTYNQLDFFCVDEIVLVEEPNARVFEDLKDSQRLTFVPEKFKKHPQFINGRVYERWYINLLYHKYNVLVDKETRQMYFDRPVQELMFGLNVRLEYQIKYDMELIKRTFN